LLLMLPLTEESCEEICRKMDVASQTLCLPLACLLEGASGWPNFSVSGTNLREERASISIAAALVAAFHPAGAICWLLDGAAAHAQLRHVLGQKSTVDMGGSMTWLS